MCLCLRLYVYMKWKLNNEKFTSFKNNFKFSLNIQANNRAYSIKIEIK